MVEYFYYWKNFLILRIILIESGHSISRILFACVAFIVLIMRKLFWTALTSFAQICAQLKYWFLLILHKNQVWVIKVSERGCKTPSVCLIWSSSLQVLEGSCFKSLKVEGTIETFSFCYLFIKNNLWVSQFYKEGVAIPQFCLFVLFFLRLLKLY